MAILCRILLLPLMLVMVAPGFAQNLTTNLKRLSLEELLDIDVSSVQRTEISLADTPAAVTVLTTEDIQRSGATSLPELLRYVPGIEVARKDSDHWSVAVRGFGSQFSKDVLILIDGRSVYTPLFEGVFWDVQDVLPENIQRIEFIRGPGGTIWGANAVNGVINIITKNAKFTHGQLVTLRGGVVDRAAGAVRYGGGNGNTFDYRVNLKAFNRGAEFHSDGNRYDQWRMKQGGFRLDGDLNTRDAWMLKGEIYNGTTGEAAAIGSFTPPGQLALIGDDTVSGANLIGQWRRRLDRGAELQINSYYDLSNRKAPHFQEHRNTFDVDFIHRVGPLKQHGLTWGLQTRVSPSRFTQRSPTLDFQPRRKTSSVYSAFVQDEIQSSGGRVSVTIGSKFEHNNYTGLETQPSIRLLWKPGERHTIWGAVTRAVRTPARTDEDVNLTVFLQPGLYASVTGNRNLRAEQLIGYETGYRSVLTSKVGVDFAVFHNEYDHVVSVGSGGKVSAQAAPIPHTLVTLQWANGIRARTDGFEVAPDLRLANSWQLKGSYSFIHVDAKNKPGNSDINAVRSLEGSTPQHVFFVQSLFDLPKRLQFDQTVRFVSATPAQQVKEHTTADARLSWDVTDQLQLALVGQNLLQPRHAEFGRDLPPIVQIRRNAYVSLRWVR
jgi:iron complex outermembrane recepter protein